MYYRLWLGSGIRPPRTIPLGPDLIKALQCIETFVFRRLICGYPTNALNKIFCTLHSEAKKAMSSVNSYTSSVIYLLLIKTRSSVFPRDEVFKTAFATKDIYSMQKKNKLYLFDRLENQESRETTDLIDKINNRTYTIEHIMPQTLNKDWQDDLGENYETIHQEWLNTIANLTLSGYNSNYQNKKFTDKKEAENGYNSSPLRLNQYLKTCNKWSEIEMKHRLELILQVALKLWPYPTTDYIVEKRAENEHSLNDDYDFKNSNLKKFTLMGTVYNTNDWTDMLETVLKTLCDLDSDAMANLPANLQSTYISTSPKDKGRWIQITDGVFVNVNTDTMTKVRILRDVFEDYDIDTDELHFILSNSGSSSKAVDKMADKGKEKRGKATQTDTQKLRFEFWSKFLAYFDSKPIAGLRHNEANTDHWHNFYIGLSGFHYAVVTTVKGWVSVQCYFSDGDKVSLTKERYDKIKVLCQSKIESAFNPADVEWNRLDNKKASYFQVKRVGSDLNDKDAWEEMQKWLLETMSKLNSIISPYYDEIRKIK